MNTAENLINESQGDGKLVFSERQRANFWAKVNKDGPIPAHRPELGPCWVWTANTHYKGYGLFKFGTKTCKAHRISYAMHHSEIPAGMLVCHACDNRACIRPTHLWLGTDKDNCDDKIAKGRENAPKGEANGGGGKLTWEKVREIRRLRSEDGLSQQAIADMFGVTQPMIGFIVRGEVWIE